MNLKTSLFKTTLAALTLALLVAPSGCFAEDDTYEIFLLGDHAKNFTKGLSPDQFLAAYGEAFDGGNNDWRTGFSVTASMPENFRQDGVPFEQVGKVNFGPIQVLLYQDRVKRERNPTHIHAFAVGQDQLDDGSIETLDTISWARAEAVDSTHDFTVGGRELVFVLAGRLRSKRNEAVTKGVVKKYISYYGARLASTVENFDLQDWPYYAACWSGLAGVSTDVDWDTFSDAAMITDIYKHVFDAMNTAYNAHGYTLVEKRREAIKAAKKAAARDADHDQVADAPEAGFGIGLMGIDG